MDILEKYDLTSRDAIHIAFMINRNIKEACTYDKHFFKVEEITARRPEEILNRYRE